MSAIIRIGNKHYLGAYKLFIVDGEDAQISLPLPNSEDPLIISIVFATDETAPNKRRVEVTGDGQDALVTFTNWNSDMGVITQRHIGMAKSQDGDEISFLASVRTNKKVRELDIQFLHADGLADQESLANEGGVEK